MINRSHYPISFVICRSSGENNRAGEQKQKRVSCRVGPGKGGGNPENGEMDAKTWVACRLFIPF